MKKQESGMDKGCELCNCRDFKTLYRAISTDRLQAKYHSITGVKFGEHGRIVRCKRCGLVYAYESPSLNELISYYEKMDNKEYLLEDVGRSKTYEKFFKSLQKLGIKSGKLLDIGCETGLLLNMARNRGWEVTGVEPSQWARTYARDHFKILEVLDDINDLEHLENTYDVITMMDVIEHLKEPKEMLKTLRKLIKNSGVLYITTPNIGSFVARLFGKHWWSILDSHLFYFNPETIVKLLRKTGFEIIKIESHGRYFSFGYWLGRLAQYLNMKITIPRIKKLIYLDMRDQMEAWTAPVGEERPK